jgi:hypothetical protein
MAVTWKAVGLVLVLAMLLAGVVSADNVQNDVIAGVSDTFPLGDSTTVYYKITANNGDGETGCNATGASPATVSIITPDDVTATPGSLTFDSCGTSQLVVFTASAEGEYTIQASVSDDGPGTYNVAPARFTLRVLAPVVADDTTPPSITCPPAVTVSANADCEAVGVSLGSPSVSDDQDDNPAVTNDAPGVFPLGLTLVTWTATDASGNSASCSQMVTVGDDTPPTIVCAADVQVANDAGQQYATVTLEAPEADDNCSIASVTNNAPPTFPMGTTLVTWTATDGAGFTATCTQKVTVEYAFDGFFRPVEMSALNKAKAGSAIPIKFSLGSNVGLSIFEAGYPKSVGIQCGPTDVVGGEIETVNAGGSSLSYDAEANQYVYVWKTDKGWVGTCRQFTIMLNDGTPHTANFTFTK